MRIIDLEKRDTLKIKIFKKLKAQQFKLNNAFRALKNRNQLERFASKL